MPLTIPRVSLSIATGTIAAIASPSGRGQFVLVGPCSAGPINTLTPVTTVSSLRSTFGVGPAIEGGAYALTYVTDRLLFLRTDTAGETPGAYGTIGVSAGAAFNAVADTVILPKDDLEVVVEFLTGGTVSSTGITYRYSLDGGRKFSGELELGTALFISLDTPYGAGKFNLYPAEADFAALVADIRTQFLAHAVFTTGGVHTIPDPNVYTITTPTTYATALTALGQLITAMATHVVELGTVHGIADTAAQTALGLLTAPTTIYTGMAVANSLRDILTTHEGLTAGGVHGAADTTNLITEPNSMIDVVAGESFDCVTTAPRWSSDALVAALEVLRDTSRAFGGIGIVGPFATLGEVQAAHAALLDMRTQVKYRRAVGHFRARNAGETALAYSQAFETAFGSADCDTIALTPSVYAASAVNKGAIYVRPYSFFAAPRTAVVAENISAADMDGFGKAPGMQIRDSAGEVLARAVDEQHQELFTPLRGFAPATIPKRPDSEVWGCQSATLAAEDSDTSTLDVAQVLDLAAEEAYLPLRERIGKSLVPATGGVLDPDEKKRIEEYVTEKLSKKMVGSNKVVGVRLLLDPDQVIVSPPPRVVTGKVLVKIFGKIDEFAITIAVEV